MLRVHLCGSVAVEADGARLPDSLLAGRQGRLVLAFLTCERRRAVPRDELAELLWGDEVPESWQSSLSVVVSKLRRMFGEAGLDGSAVLTTEGGSYRLHLPADAWVDWDAAREAVDRAERAVAEGDWPEAIAGAREGAQIAERGFLTDDCPWVDGQRERLRNLHVRALQIQTRAHLAANERSRAVLVAKDAVALDELSEESYRLLMHALAAAGERAEALRVWERCRIMLADELGVDPAPETEAVYLSLLGDASPAPGGPTAASATQLPSGVVTFLLTDIVESSALWEHNPAAMGVALERHDRLVEEVVSRHGGTMLKAKLEGDATVSVFPRASGAVATGLDLRDAIAAEPWPDGAAIRVRMALHTGEAMERDGDYFGPALNRAARLRAMAGEGQILVSQAVAELVRDHLPEDASLVPLGEHQLRGLSRGENVFALVAGAHDDGVAAPLERPPLPIVLRADGPFVGRGEELSRLDAEWATAVAGTPRALLIAGEPGVGKTRLAAECAGDLFDHGALVLYGRCDEELGAPYQPFAESLRDLVPTLGPHRLRSVRGVEQLARLVPDLIEHPPVTPSDPDTERSLLFDAFARLLATVSSETPLLIVIDDLHWAAKPTLLLLRHLLRSGAGSRLLIVGTYRSTDLSRSHPLAAALADLHRDGTADRLALSGLAAADVSAYLRATGHHDASLGATLSTVTSGNPFFLIEVLRHVEESGGRWDPTTLPQGVREAVDRRLTRLSPMANEALLAGAVVGNQFSLDLIEKVLETDLVDPIDEARRAGLVVEEAGNRFRFDHALVRQSLLAECVSVKRVRLHQRIASALEAEPAVDAHLADLARHYFECAFAGGAAKAVDYSRRAGEQAMGRLAYEEAADLYAQAAQAADVDGSGVSEDERAELLLAECEALLAAGDPAAAGVVDQLAAAARHSSRLSAWATCFRSQLAVLVHPEHLEATVAEVGAAAEALARLGDAEGEAKAHTVRASCLAHLGRVAECEAALDRALVAARLADNPRHVNAVLAFAPLAALQGPSAVPQASGRCLDVVRVLRITTGSPAVEAAALRCQAVLEAVRGRFEPARRMLESARRSLEALGHTHGLLETDLFSGMVELAAGRAADGEEPLRRAYNGFVERGVGVDAAQAAALLARVLVADGRLDEALTLTEESERLAGVDLKAAILWRAARAEALTRKGQIAEAVEVARSAVALVDPTDALLDRAEAHLTLAVALTAAGDATTAEREAQLAGELYERKGAAALATAVQRLVGAARRPRPPSAPVIRRRLRPNAAADRSVSSHELWRTGNLDDYFARLSADFVDVDHTTHVTTDRSQFIRFAGQVATDEQTDTQSEAIACLGRRHVLSRYVHHYAGSALVDRVNRTGPLEFVTLVVERQNADGLTTRIERFRADDLHLAIGRLIELHADDELPPDRRPGRYAIANMFRSEQGGTRTVDCEVVDHRPAGLWTISGRDALEGAEGELMRLSPDMRWHIVDLLGLTEDLELVRVHADGHNMEGGPVEIDVLMVAAFDRDGSSNRSELFLLTQIDAALARFDELDAQAEAVELANAATRHMDLLAESIHRRDWVGLRTIIDEDAFVDDRRAIVAHRAEGRDAVIAFNRSGADAGVRGVRRATVALRGDRLTLGSFAVDTAGLTDIQLLCVSEVSDRDQHLASVVFDRDDVDAAYDELDARYLAGEGAPHADATQPLFALARALNRGETGPGRALLRDDALLINRGRAEPELLTNIATPIRVIRIDDVTERGSVSLWQCGPRNEFVTVLCATEDGLIARLEAFSPTHLHEATALLHAKPFRRRVRPNAASAANARITTQFVEGDFDGWEASISTDFVDVDHVAHVTTDRATFVRAGRMYADMDGLAVTTECVATLGDRHALVAGVWRYAGAAIGDPDKRTGPAVFTYLQVNQADAEGRLRRIERFAAGDVHLALGRLVELHAEDELPAERRAGRDRIARKLASRETSYTDDVDVVDHRPAGLWTLAGRTTMEGAQQSFRGLIPDLTWRTADVIGFSERVTLLRVDAQGHDTDGGPIEFSALAIDEYDSDGFVRRIQLYLPEQIDDALARFDELSTRPLSDAIHRRVRPNGASEWNFGAMALFIRGDFETWEAAYADDFVDVDHVARVTSDRNTFFRAARMYSGAEGPTFDQILLATLGSRHALWRGMWRYAAAPIGDPDKRTGPVEFDYLVVCRIDTSGRGRRIERFAVGDLHLALARLVELHAEDELPPERQPERDAVADSFRQLKPRYSQDAVLVDHRAASMGTIEGRDALLDLPSVRTILQDPYWRLTDVLALEERFVLEAFVSGGLDEEGNPVEWRGLALVATDRDGLQARFEWFALDQVDQALARFDELAGPPRAVPRRRVLANRATARYDENVRLMSAGDIDAWMELFTDDYVDVDHTTHVTTGLDAMRQMGRRYAEVPHGSIDAELLASLGQRHCLQRIVTRMQDASIVSDDSRAGEIEIALLVVTRVDAAGRTRRIERFRPEDVSLGLARLIELHAEDELASDRRRAQEAVAGLVRTITLRWSDDATLVDHRPASMGTVRGREAIRQVAAASATLVPDPRWRFTDVLGFTEQVHLVTFEAEGYDGHGGLARWDGLSLMEVGDDALYHRLELFLPEQVGEALARFDELTGSDQTIDLHNDAMRYLERQVEAIRDGDIGGIAALAADDVVFEDRRQLVRYRVEGRDAWVADQRSMIDARVPRIVMTPIATRGDRIVLQRTTAGGDQTVLEAIGVTEVSAAGQVVRSVIFDPHDIDAAFDELDAIYLAEGTPAGDTIRPLLAFASNFCKMDADGCRRTLHPDLTVADHRATPNLYDGVQGPDEFINVLWTNFVVATRASARVLAIEAAHGDTALVLWTRTTSTADGADAELRFHILLTTRHAAIYRLEFFSLDDRDRAMARFDELASSPEEDYLANAASRVGTRARQLWLAHRFSEVEALLAADTVCDDRRPIVGYRAEGPGAFMGYVRGAVDAGWTRTAETLIATRGNRLALHRMSSGGPLTDVESLVLDGISADGLIELTVVFATADEDAAFAELDARYAAGEGAGLDWPAVVASGDAYNRRDWDAFERTFANDLVYVDRTPGRFGTMTRAELLDALKALFPLVPDAKVRVLAVPRHTAAGQVYVYERTGHDTTGAPVCWREAAVTLVEGGRTTRMEPFPVTELAAAVARFDELTVEPAEPSMTNAAGRAAAAGTNFALARRWHDYEALIAPDAVGDDRRAIVGYRFEGRAGILNYARDAVEGGVTRFSHTAVATRGDRLLLARTSAGGPLTEIESLTLHEVSETGQIVFWGVFDVTDVDAAYAELDARFAAGEGAACNWPSQAAATDALNRRDWPAFERCWADDVVYVDHTPGRFGNASRADLLAALKAVFDLVPDATIRALAVPRLNAAGNVVVYERSGHDTYGAPVCWRQAALTLLDGPVATRIEAFPIDRLDDAVARFDALAGEMGDPYVVNEATRNSVSSCKALVARDWEAAGAYYADDVVLDDRRAIIGAVITGRRALLEMSQDFGAAVTDIRAAGIATRGDRLALIRIITTTDALTRHETVAVNEVSELGQMLRSWVFDLADIDAAFAELDARFAAGDGAPFDWAAQTAAFAAYNRRDWAAFEATVADDLVYVDHQPGRFGQLTRTELLAAIESMIELVPDATLRVLAVPRLSLAGRVLIYERTGHDTTGAPVSWREVEVTLTRDGLTRRIEIFPLDQMATALTRWDELTED